MPESLHGLIVAHRAKILRHSVVNGHDPVPGQSVQRADFTGRKIRDRDDLSGSPGCQTGTTKGRLLPEQFCRVLGMPVQPDVMDRHDAPMAPFCTYFEVGPVKEIQPIQLSTPFPGKPSGFHPCQSGVTLPRVSNRVSLRPRREVTDKLIVFIQGQETREQMIYMPSDTASITNHRTGIDAYPHPTSALCLL